ncbi:MAG: hypothetical protein OXU36_07525 [Candidatus Poribacteria bacterium]|nr:hypothetical protein [Candidatus Poribacteria bacterium]
MPLLPNQGYQIKDIDDAVAVGILWCYLWIRHPSIKKAMRQQFASTVCENNIR